MLKQYLEHCGSLLRNNIKNYNGMNNNKLAMTTSSLHFQATLKNRSRVLFLNTVTLMHLTYASKNLNITLNALLTCSVFKHLLDVQSIRKKTTA